jgi:hypothetical protein
MSLRCWVEGVSLTVKLSRPGGGGFGSDPTPAPQACGARAYRVAFLGWGGSSESLDPYARNTSMLSKTQGLQIAASMPEFGFSNPVLTDAAGSAVVGHERVRAAASVWKDGKHRVLCGDATKAEDVQKATGGPPAACIWPDPPHNVASEGNAGAIANDSMDGSDFAPFLTAAFVAMGKAVVPGGAIDPVHRR